MKVILFLVAFVLVALFFFSIKNDSHASGEPRTPVLVELFTSEGCSSCPPADSFLMELKQKQPVSNAQVIALGQHVDYWNSIGWIDRFSSPQFTARQQQYADRLNDGPYTPQIVIDGIASLVGNDVNGVSSAIAKAAAKIKPVHVELSEDGDEMRINLLGLSNSSPEVFFALVEDDLESHVKAGENEGVTLHHVGVTRELRSLGRAVGNTWATAVPVHIVSEGRKDKSQAVVFVQDSGGKIIGVNTITLR